MNIYQTKTALAEGSFDEKLIALYGKDKLDTAKKRYCDALSGYVSTFGDADNIMVFSVSGRSEISGNHTDHNSGKVIAAAIDLDVVAVAAPRCDGKVVLKSEGFPMDTVCLDTVEPNEDTFYTSHSLICGMLCGFKKNGFKTGGFSAYTVSNVLKGSGLSSSAAFEVTVGTILNHLYNKGNIAPAMIAKIAQYAENVHFGKKCGLMDQLACAVGGFITVDFADEGKPVIKKLSFDLTSRGYYLYIVDTGGSHADLSDEYSAVADEMKKVASLLGATVLREASLDKLIENAALIRKEAGDRAFLRALHYFNENERVDRQASALERGDLKAFLADVVESGASSFRFLQNVYSTKSPTEQGVSIALALSEQILKNKRAGWRVHGGGFAGTIQAFVPFEVSDEYRNTLEKIFGKGSCMALRVRESGAIRVI